MPETKIPAKQPAAFTLEAGKTYAWCTCGGSEKQPMCDGSHRGTEFTPLVFRAESAQETWLCQCKRTGTAPRCDGTHKKL